MTNDRAIQVRAANVADAPALVSLSRALALHVHDPDPGDDPGPILAGCFHPDSWCEYLVAVQVREVVGFISFCRRFEAHTRTKSLWIADLVVAASQRSFGVGSALLSAVRQRARDLGATAISLEVWKENQAALSFYIGLGASVLNDRHIVEIPIMPSGTD